MKIGDCRIGFIGFGHMAQIIFKAIDQARLIPRSQIYFIQRDPSKMNKNQQEFGITSTSLKNLVDQTDFLILGVRPSQALGVLEELSRFRMNPSKKIISVIAGIQISYYERFLQNPILRVMPNLASEVGMGMTVFTYNSKGDLEFRSLTHLLFSCMGEVIEVAESMMDICCAIAGSGPGFVFRLIEAMARSGEREGLPYPKALKMAAQTFAGAAQLILKKGEAEDLLFRIATPHGTTEAGLKMMSALKIDDHFQAVLSASSNRSKELSQEHR